MTLLVGIFCAEGVVIATDRQASMGAIGSLTVASPVTKVQLLADSSVLYASSGALGLSQQLCAVIGTDAKGFRAKPYASEIQSLQKKLRTLIDPALDTAARAAQVVGSAAQSDALCGGLLAAQFSDGLKLIEISVQAGVEYMTAELPYCCMGSGKQNADPFLKFIWSVFFEGRQPTLAECAVMAYWTVRHGIDSKSFAVGFEPDVFVLEPSGKNFRGRQLSKAELSEHDAFIDSVKSAMRSVKGGNGNAQIAPAPPTIDAQPHTS